MKYIRRTLAVLTAAAVLVLTGCSAMLERSFTSVTPHNSAPTAEGDPSVLRADSYQELVNALIYLVNAGAQEGTIRLYLDPEELEGDLEAACLEVVQEDPLGAYAVEHIKYSVSSLVPYDEARVSLTYRRTPEQIASIVQATGVTAIRTELAAALSAFDSECVLRISYFDGDEDFIRDLAAQAYYSVPVCALGMPQLDIQIYPDSGLQRIVEILLTYPLDSAELSRRARQVELWLEELTAPLADRQGDALLPGAARAILAAGTCTPEGGSTAYALMEDGLADSEGFALALAALGERLELSCQVARGTLGDQPHFWNVVRTSDGWRHLDLSALAEGTLLFYTDQELSQLGYLWDADSLPPCGPSEGEG